MFLDWLERKGEAIKPETNEAAGPRTLPRHQTREDAQGETSSLAVLRV